MRSDFFFRLSGKEKRQTEVLKILHGFTDSVIIARRQELESKAMRGEVENDKEDDVGGKKKLALLDVLLQSTIDGKPLTNMDIREEVDTFMFEGHDTTTSGIAFCLYNLAKYPEVQQKAFEEIQNVIGDSDKPVSQKDLNDLNYLDLVIKETLRLFPSVPVFGRKMKEDVEISEKAVQNIFRNFYSASSFQMAKSSRREVTSESVHISWDVMKLYGRMRLILYPRDSQLTT